MRTTVTLDDDLVSRASELLGIGERSTLIRLGLQLLIQTESARRLAALGGSDPTASAGRRSRLDQ
ncbi:MAG: type II toxin-antitoxin system VapB family antitoxin [Propionibacteriaceae bacterium]|jgi:Arc/MetJ family transcription regulator|nr:type II toxin-antitoxin system VapB family antitoxin [Propionibacteriaceae bacterium]